MPEISSRTTAAPFIRAITPSASVLDPAPRGLYIGTSGTISVDNGDGTTVSAIPVVAGSTLLIQPTKITAAGGGATVYGLYDR
jgi:hypothetical protein